MEHEHSLRHTLRRARPSVLPSIGLALLVTVTVLLYRRGHGFYILDVDARVDHPDFRLLSPGEYVGHGYGIVGTILILSNLLYLVRRKYPLLLFGSVKAWLRYHIFAGFVGSVLVLFHSAFQLRTTLATVTSVSLALVVATGIVGMYLHILMRPPDERKLVASLSVLDNLAKDMGSQIFLALEYHPVTELPGNASLIDCIKTVPTWWGQIRERRAAIRRVYRASIGTQSLPRADRKAIQYVRDLASAYATAQVRTIAGNAILRTWRPLHRFLAILMLISVSVHIVVAWFYGYRWIWSSH